MEWQWSLNWGDIRHDIVVGSCPMTIEDIDRIAGEAGATALLSLQTDLCRGAFSIDFSAHQTHARRRNLQLANVPMRDFDPPEQRRLLPDAVRALTRLIGNGGTRVYVYCTAGINRSPLTVLGYLTFVEGLTTEAAMDLILHGRPVAEPYWDSYYGCRHDLVEQYRDAIELRAWDASRYGEAGDADFNWLTAERDVIREVFLATAASNEPRLDPHRM